MSSVGDSAACCASTVQTPLLAVYTTVVNIASIERRAFVLAQSYFTGVGGSYGLCQRFTPFQTNWLYGTRCLFHSSTDKMCNLLYHTTQRQVSAVGFSRLLFMLTM